MANTNSEIYVRTQKLINLAKKQKTLSKLQSEGKDVTTFDNTMGIYRSKLANPTDATNEMKRIIAPLTAPQRLKVLTLLDKTANDAIEEIKRLGTDQCEAGAIREACDFVSGFVYAELDKYDISTK